MMADTACHSRTRSEYLRLTEAGVFNDTRVELLDGRICNVSRLSPEEATALRLTALSLRTAFSDGFLVSTRMPVTLSDCSEPEPDVSVAPGTPRDYSDQHPGPSDTLLLVEVSSSNDLTKDRGLKMAAYAGAGIADYWIVNLPDRQLEVYREPTPVGIYTHFRVYRSGDSVAPLSAPDHPVAVADLLPTGPKQDL